MRRKLALLSSRDTEIFPLLAYDMHNLDITKQHLYSQNRTLEVY